MTIKEYFNSCNTDDFDVCDTVLDDVYVAFVLGDETSNEPYDKFLSLLANNVEVIVPNSPNESTITCKFSEFAEKYNDAIRATMVKNNGNFEFDEPDEAYLNFVSDLNALIAGYAGDATYEMWNKVFEAELKPKKIYEYSDFESLDLQPKREHAAESEKTRLFVDMDGTLAVFNPTKKLEDLFEEGYFRNLEPYREVVEAIRQIVTCEPNLEVFILSAYLTESKFALKEKNEWLDEYLPEIDQAHRCFCPCGTSKADYVPGKEIKETDTLLDDYTINLNDFDPPGVGIKLLNGINDTHKSWKGERISRFQSSTEIAMGIINNIRIALGKDSEDKDKGDDGVEL